MPRIGIFFLNISFGTLWKFFEVTVDGPPEKIKPLTPLKIFILESSSGVNISE